MKMIERTNNDQAAKNETGSDGVFGIFGSPGIALLLLSTVGCLGTNPGREVRTALNEEAEFTWTSEDDLRVKTEGTHEAEWLLGTGEIRMMLGPDGDMIVDPAASVFTQILWSKPHAGAAGDAAAAAFLASTEQVKHITESVNKVLDLAASFAPVPGGVGGATDEPVVVP